MRWYWAAAIGVAAAAGTAWLTRRQRRGTQVAASVGALLLPLGVNAAWNAATKPTGTPSCVLLFTSDTHGAAASNEQLATAMAAERGVSAVLHGGDVADLPELWGAWWDRPFDDRLSPTPIFAASGNHDVTSAAQLREFKRRFGELPRTVRCGDVEVYLLPWEVTAAHGTWLLEQVRASTARWRVLVLHRPLWPSTPSEYGDSRSALTRRRLEDALSSIHLVLAGHDHNYWDSTHDVPGGRVRQLIVVGGPKAYECDPRATGCRDHYRAYLRIEAYPDELRVLTRQVE